MKLVPATEIFYEGGGWPIRIVRRVSQPMGVPLLARIINWISSDALQNHYNSLCGHMTHRPRHRPRLPLSETHCCLMLSAGSPVVNCKSATSP